jgi:hypothetical protein
MVNSSQFLLISFAYKATPSSKKSSQSFKVGVAMFLEGGKCYWCRDCCLVRVHVMCIYHLVRLSFSTRL